MAADLPCPCSVAVLAATDNTGPDHAITAYEHAAFQALAVGAQFYIRRHDTGHPLAETAQQLHLIARQSRIVHAQLEQQLATDPPTPITPPLMAGRLRAHAIEYGRIAAWLYREAARQDAAAPADHLICDAVTSADSALSGTA